MRLKQRNFAEAERFLGEAIGLARESEDPFGEAPAWRWLGMAFEQQHKSAEMTHAMEQARTLYRDIGMLHEVANLSQWLADNPA